MSALVFAMALATMTIQGEPDRSFDSNGVAIHYTDTGRGVPVVLIHGFAGSSARHWAGPGVLAAIEKAGYRVIAMDCRGHGRSDKPLESRQYGLEMVRDVVRLLDHLSLQRAHVVGLSMGGAIASQLLIEHPNRLLAVTLVGVGWEGDDLTALTAQMREMTDGFEKRDADALVRRVFRNGQRDLTVAEVAAATASLFERNDPQILVAAGRTLPTLFEVPSARLRATTVPLLAVIGEYDDNLEAVLRLAHIIPGIQIVKIPGANHATILRSVASHLIPFLDSHRER